MSQQLPPDPEGQNDDRADWAGIALQEFQDITRCEPEEALPDLLCNLMHWCDRHDTDFNEALLRARDNYEEETLEP